MIKACDLLLIDFIHQNYMYIEIIQTFEIELIIADTKLIYAPYRIFKSGVKLKARKMRL